MRAGVFDDMHRKLVMPESLQRIVSLVPSDTETVFALGMGERIVGRTRYCVEPAGEVDTIDTVGGTKDVDVEAVFSLKPDLILANQEENSRADLEALATMGCRVFISFPKRYPDAVAHVARLARMIGGDRSHREQTDLTRELLRRGYRNLEPRPQGDEISVFVPIWREPLMTFSEYTYAHEILRLAGAANVFAKRQRRYPLKADLGLRSPLPADQVANRDQRYPRISEAELVAHAPELVLLPDEPYRCTERDRDYFAGLEIPAARTGKILFVDGKDLFWPGSRSVDALPRLSALIAGLR